nr:collagen alpha-1(I) chain-like [Rhipicephalus microplus]
MLHSVVGPESRPPVTSGRVSPGQLLLVLLAAGAAAVPHVGHSDEGFKQYRAPEPGGYSYGYSPAHGEGGGASWRKESADAAGNVIGSYGFKDPDARVRLVTYVANQDGFQANVQSNEPGLPQRNLGLGAGITQWPIPQVPAHAHHAGAHSKTEGTGPHHGSRSTGARPPVALGHADDSVGAPYRFSYDSSATGGPFQHDVGDALGINRDIYGLSGQRVNNVADAGGFRASVQSNEPGVGNTKSAFSLGSPSSASSGRQEDGDNGLIFPPPYPGGPGASGSGAPGHGTEDGSGTADDDGVRTTVESNEPGFNGAQNPADVDVYKMPGLVGIALVFSGPHGSAPAGAALIPPSGLGIEGRSLPVGPTGVGFLAPPRIAGPVYTNYGQQGGSTLYNFAYANGQVVGPRQQKYGDAAANKEGSYGVTVDDDRFHNVDYVTGTNGFSASGETNEPAGDGAQRPADVDITKSSESAGTAPMGESSGPDGSGLPTGSGGFQGVHGHVIPAAPPRPALTGQPRVLLVPGSAGYPTVQGRAFVPVGSAGPASPGLPAVSVVPGSYGFNFIHSYPSGTGAPGLNVPVSTTNVILPSPALSPVGGYSFGYTGGPGGVVHRETGDTSGTNSGVYGFNGEGGAVRNLNYAANGGEFRASVQRNQHGIDTSQNLAGGFVGALRGF